MEYDLEKISDNTDKKLFILEREKELMDNPIKVNVPFHKSKRANYYLREYAAGIDWKQGGRPRFVYVKYANGEIKRARNHFFFVSYPKVDEGAMIFVDSKPIRIKKERKPIDWYKVVRDTFAVVTSGLTLFVLINTLNR